MFLINYVAYMKSYFLIIIIFLLHINTSFAEIGIGTGAVTTKHFTINVKNQFQQVKINTLQAWTIKVTDKTGMPVKDAEFTIKGGMPDHDHGLPTQPRVTQYLGKGDYLLEGLRFHMPGRWQLELTIEANGKKDNAFLSFELP